MAVAQERDRLLFGKWSYDEVEVRSRRATDTALRLLYALWQSVVPRPPTAGSPWLDRSPPLEPLLASPCLACTPCRYSSLRPGPRHARAQVSDISLEDYISTKRGSVYTPHTAGRYQKKRFRKAQCPIVERCARTPGRSRAVGPPSRCLPPLFTCRALERTVQLSRCSSASCPDQHHAKSASASGQPPSLERWNSEPPHTALRSPRPRPTLHARRRAAGSSAAS